MNDKKKVIMEEAIKLFANKGYDTTPIQEIANQCGISKGAFYLHFRSKEELMLSIFQYYLEGIQQKMIAIEHTDYSPREKFIHQLEIQLQEVLRQKELFILQFREQMLYMNKDIEQYFKKISDDRKKWHETSFLALYGENIHPYLLDMSRLFDGMVNAYLKLMIQYNIQLDVKQLASFIMNRLDDIVHGMRKNHEEPILTKAMFTDSNHKYNTFTEKMDQLLIKMEAEIHSLRLDQDRKDELLDTLHFLMAENRKDKPERFIFKGMLNNFNDIEKLRPFIEQITNLMGIH